MSLLENLYIIGENAEITAFWSSNDNFITNSMIFSDLYKVIFKECPVKQFEQILLQEEKKYYFTNEIEIKYKIMNKELNVLRFRINDIWNDEGLFDTTEDENVYEDLYDHSFNEYISLWYNVMSKLHKNKTDLPIAIKQNKDMRMKFLIYLFKNSIIWHIIPQLDIYLD